MCVRPRFEKDSIFRNTIIVSFPPINYQLFERDRHDLGTWPIFFHAGQLPVSSKDFDRFVGKSVTVQREEETGLGEKPFESISGRGLEIWEERKGESESSSHRDESGSFSSGKNSGSNRDARLATRFDIETDSWTRKRERERDIESWRNETKIMKKKDFILVYSTRRYERFPGWYFEDERVLALLKLDDDSQFIVTNKDRRILRAFRSPTIFTRTRDKTRTTCTTFSKLDTELPRDLTSPNDRPCRVCGFFFFLFFDRSCMLFDQTPRVFRGQPDVWEVSRDAVRSNSGWILGT